MPRLAIVGVVLIVLGIAGFVVPRIDFTTEETIIDVGPGEGDADRRRTITIPDVASGAAIAAGVALTLVGAGRRR